MKRFVAVALLFLVLAVGPLQSQVLSVGGPNEDNFEAIETIGENGLIAVGTHNDSLVFQDTVLRSFNQNDPYSPSGKSEDVFLAKTDTNFQLQWIHQMGGLAFSTPNNLKTHKNRLTLTVNFFQRLIFKNDTFRTGFEESRGSILFNMNEDGSLNWKSQYNSPSEVSVADIVLTENNQTLVLGNWQDTLTVDQQSFFSPGFNSFLINYKPNGTKKWIKIIENPVFTHDLTKGPKAFYLAGNVGTSALSLGNTPIVPSDTGDRLFIVKLNQQFRPIWTKTGYHGISRIENLVYHQNTQSLYASGTFDDYLFWDNFKFKPGPGQAQTFNGFLFKIDSSGTGQFGKYKNLDDGGTLTVENGEILFTANVDSGEQVLGFESKNSTFSEGWIGWLNSDGTIKKHIMTEGTIDPSSNRIEDVAATNNQTLYATGSYNFETTFGDSTLSRIGGSNDGFIWKIPNFTSGSSGIRQVKSGKRSPIKAYPNPTSDKLILEDNRQNTQTQPVTLYNSQGQPVKQGLLTPGTNTWYLDLPSGLYFLRLNGEDGASGAKRIIVR